MVAKKHPPVHPGEILMLEFLEPLQISQYRLAKDVSVPPRRINEIVKGTRSITANLAIRGQAAHAQVARRAQAESRVGVTIDCPTRHVEL